MAGLTNAELYKRDFRVTKFLKKYKEKDPFELVDGRKVKLLFDQEIYDAVSKKENVNNLFLFTEDGEKLKFGKLKKNAEFGGGGGGGSGAGAKQTEIGESAQCVYCQAYFDSRGKTDFSVDDLKKAYRKSDVDASLNDVLKLSEDWVLSSITSAKKIYEEIGNKGYTFHRGSKWVDTLESHFKTLNKKEGSRFSNINKWSPADIYALTPKGASTNVKEAKTLHQLNEIIKKGLDSKDIIPLSLKKVADTAKIRYYNYGERRKEIRLKEYICGKIEFFKAKDVYLVTSDNVQIQLRTFPSWQAEIKGTLSSGGKVGGGVLNVLLKDFKAKSVWGNTFPHNFNSVRKEVENAFSKKDKKVIKHFFDNYEKYAKSKESKKLNWDEFQLNVFKQDPNWLCSKYLGMELIHQIMHNRIQHKFVEEVMYYASSNSAMSAPFLKVYI